MLAALGRRLPSSSWGIVSGVSAGAINAACLASHRGSFGEATARLRDHWSGLRTQDVFRSDLWSLAGIVIRWGFTLFSGGRKIGPTARSLVDTGPLRRFLERVVDAEGIDLNVRKGRLRAVAISATSYQTGQTITFVQGEPSLPLWQRVQREAVRDRITPGHVLASSAIPLLFPAVRLGEHYFGDGSLRQWAPLAPAVHLGARRILAVSSRYGRSRDEAGRPQVVGYPPPAQVVGLLLNSIFLDTLDADAARLLRINHLLEDSAAEEPVETARAAPTGPARENDSGPLHPVELLVLRPSQDIGRIAARHRDRLPRAVRYLARGLGTHAGESSDLLSYLLFEPDYIDRLIELGEADLERSWPRVESFLSGRSP